MQEEKEEEEWGKRGRTVGGMEFRAGMYQWQPLGNVCSAAVSWGQLLEMGWRELRALPLYE